MMERRVKKSKKKEKKKEKEGLGLGFLDDIPQHILCDIMLKLPACSIIRCSSVCRTFRNLLSDSTFQQLYSSRGPPSCLVLSESLSLSCIDAPPTAKTPSSNSSLATLRMPQSETHNPSCTSTSPIHKHKQSQSQSQHHTTRFSLTFPTRIPMTLVNSTHGLLCLRHRFHTIYYICNPLLGELLTVYPAPRPANNQNLRFSSFGFDPQSKHYTILQLVLRSNRMVAELYQLGDNTWRVIDNDDASSVTVRPNSTFDPSLNGALHWLTDNRNTTSVSELICSFDLHSNKFKSVPPPSHFDVEYVNKTSGMSVGVFKGRLCLCYVVEGALFETWFMDKYGVEESWAMAFSIDIRSYCGWKPRDKHRPIGFSSCGDMWLKADSESNCLVSYSAKTGIFRDIDIGDTTTDIEAIPHVLSFVSLKDSVHSRDTRLRIRNIKTKQ